MNNTDTQVRDKQREDMGIVEITDIWERHSQEIESGFHRTLAAQFEAILGDSTCPPSTRSMILTAIDIHMKSERHFGYEGSRPFLTQFGS